MMRWAGCYPSATARPQRRVWHDRAMPPVDRPRSKACRARCGAAWLALAATSAAAAQGTGSADAPGFDSSAQTYRCTGGARLPVVYLNIKGGDAFATMFVNGHLVLMLTGPTGSGARYIAVDGQPGYRWHVKGEVGNLYFLGPGPGASESLVLQECKAQRQP